MNRVFEGERRDDRGGRRRPPAFGGTDARVLPAGVRGSRGFARPPVGARPRALRHAREDSRRTAPVGRARRARRNLERKARGNDRGFFGDAHAAGGGTRRVRTYLLVTQQRPRDDAPVAAPRRARSPLDRARLAAGPPGARGARAPGFGRRDTVSSPRGTRGGSAPRVGGDARRGRARGAHAHGRGGHLATRFPCARSVTRRVTAVASVGGSLGALGVREAVDFFTHRHFRETGQTPVRSRNPYRVSTTTQSLRNAGKSIAFTALPPRPPSCAR